MAEAVEAEAAAGSRVPAQMAAMVVTADCTAVAAVVVAELKTATRRVQAELVGMALLWCCQSHRQQRQAADCWFTPVWREGCEDETGSQERGDFTHPAGEDP